jgi:hypothetical protein
VVTPIVVPVEVGVGHQRDQEQQDKQERVLMAGLHGLGF